MQLIQNSRSIKITISQLLKLLGGSIKAQIEGYYVELFEDNCFRLTFHIGTDKRKFCPN